MSSSTTTPASTSTSMTTTTAERQKSLSVYLLRHGEREDEVPDLSLHAKRTMDKLDPRLTYTGHQQAAAAWERIVSEVCKTANGRRRRILVVSSPMRRTIGTALMVGYATATVTANRSPCNDKNVEWMGQRKSDDCAAVPIAVVNGLSDCALAVERSGGSARILDRIACAVKEGSSLLQEVDGMHQRWRDQGSDGTASAWTVTPVEFGALQKHGNSNDAIRMHATTNLRSNPPDTGFGSTLSRVTRTALHAGADALIVVTHREGIRDWIARCSCTGGTHRRRVPTPYCCIASFSVAMDNEEEELEWTFQRLDPYQKFQAHS